MRYDQLSIASLYLTTHRVLSWLLASVFASLIGKHSFLFVHVLPCIDKQAGLKHGLSDSIKQTKTVQTKYYSVFTIINRMRFVKTPQKQIPIINLILQLLVFAKYYSVKDIIITDY